MKLERRTVEALRIINRQLHERGGKFQHVYPGSYEDKTYSLYAAHRNGKFLIGIYLDEWTLRNSVETVAEFLEEVV